MKRWIHILAVFLSVVYTPSFAQSSLTVDQQLRSTQGNLGLSKVNVSDNRAAGWDAKLTNLTSSSQFATATVPRLRYDNSDWVQKTGSLTTSSPGYGFARIPGPSGTYYERELVNGWVMAAWAVTVDSTVNNTTAANKALDYAIWATPKAPKLLLPAGTTMWTQLGVYVPNVTIEGDFRGTRIKKSSTRGLAFDINASNFTLRYVTIDASASQLDGGVWASGKNITISHVKVINPDAIGIVVSGVWSNGSAFVSVATDNVRVEYCEVVGQRRYHDIGAPAPFLGGGSAKNVKFWHCISRDNNADAFDADNAEVTFDYCEAVKTGTMSTFAGYWSEGGESNQKVRYRHCRATNFAVAFGTSELAMLNVEDSHAYKCQRAIDTPNGNTYELTAINVRADSCGVGLETSDINGIFRATGPARLVNCASYNGFARYDIVNYSVTGTATALHITGGTFKSAMLAYENGGNETVYVTGTTFTGLVRWQAGGTPTRKVYIKGGNIKAVSGARIFEAVLDGITMRGDGVGTAVDLAPEWANTKVINASISNYVNAHANATWGMGNTTSGVTNAPAKIEDVLVKGSDPTRAGYYGNFTDELPSGFWASPGNAAGAPFSSAFPFIRMVGHESNGSSVMGNPAGWWHMELGQNIATGPLYWRRHHATNGFETWKEILDKSTFPLNLSSPASGQVLIYNGTNWVNTSFRMFSGSGSPEGVVTAPPGSWYINTAGGANTTLYIKEVGSGDTGWAAK